ncbi:MAG: transporter [Candidatus Didemnitutus sp.]|nr:transporter [Candidatus Didemnitutus sp.]
MSIHLIRSFAPGLFGGIFLAAMATAAPINTDTALPVHEGEVLWREQVRFMKAQDSSRDLEVFAVPSVLVYGVTEKLALIGMVPWLDKKLTMAGVERGDDGFGDSTLLGRYQVFQLDRPGETFRAQILGGLKFPTGRDDARDSLGRLPQPLQLGSGSYDPVVAGVFSWQRLQWQADFDLGYKFNTRANGFRFGDTFTHNAAFQYRLSPRTLPDAGVPAFVYGVLELNGIWAQRDEQNGDKVGDSGGYTLFVSPGLQYVTQRWVAEISVQVPLIQELNGGQLKTDYILSAGFRVQL